MGTFGVSPVESNGKEIVMSKSGRIPPIQDKSPKAAAEVGPAMAPKGAPTNVEAAHRGVTMPVPTLDGVATQAPGRRAGSANRLRDLRKKGEAETGDGEGGDEASLAEGGDGAAESPGSSAALAPLAAATAGPAAGSEAASPAGPTTTTGAGAAGTDAPAASSGDAFGPGMALALGVLGLGVALGGGGSTRRTAGGSGGQTDTTAPTASIALDKSALEAGESATVTITFSEPVSGLALDDFTVGSGALSALATSDGGKTWTATFTPTADVEDASNVVQLGSGYADLAGNAGSAATSANYAVDTKPPVLAVQAFDAVAGTVSLTFDSPLDAANPPAVSAFVVTTEGGNPNPVLAVSILGSVVTLQLTNPFRAGTLSVAYADAAGDDALAVQDAAGNDAASFAFTSGVVADGYVRGAQLYLEGPNGLVALTGVVTDDFGNFFLPAGSNPNNYALVAVGGVNIDTGLPNGTPLKAPAGSTTINPLTTLVQAVMDQAKDQGQALDAETAAEDVAAALGLTLPEGQSLTRYDPLSATDGAAVGAQKAAAQVATLAAVAASEARSPADGAEAASKVLTNLATVVGNAVASALGGQSTPKVDLADASVLTQALADVGVSDAAQVLIVEASTAIAGAKDLGAISDAQSQFLDRKAPDAPTDLAVVALASDATPSVTVRLNVSSTDGGAAVKGDTVVLLDGATEVGRVALTQAHIDAGRVVLDAAVLAEGLHSLSAQVIDKAGNMGAASAARPVEVDLTGPGAVVTSGSDNLAAGASTTLTLTFSEAVTGLTLDDLQVTGGGKLSALSAPRTVDGQQVYTVTYTAPAAGGAGSVRILGGGYTDAAGNEGAASNAVDLAAVNPPVVTIASVGGADRVVSGQAGDDRVQGTALDEFGAITVRAGETTLGTATVRNGRWTYEFSQEDLAALGQNADIAITATQTRTVGDNDYEGSASATFSIDTVAPAGLSIDAVSGGAISLADKAQGVAVTGSAEAGARVVLTIGGASKTLVADDSGDWSYTLSNADYKALEALQGGPSVTAVAVDPAGNRSTEVTQSFAIDTTAPTLGLIRLADADDTGARGDGRTADRQPSIQFIAERDASLAVEIKSGAGDFLPLGHAAMGTGELQTLSLSDVDLPDGTYVVRLTATDAAGNPAVRTATLVIDGTGPAFTSGPSATAIVENSGANQLVYTGVATDASVFSYSLKPDSGDAAAFSVDARTGQVRLTVNPDFEARASYAFTLVATDAAGNASERAVALQVQDVNEAPTAVSLSPVLAGNRIDENTDTTARLAVAHIAVTDDALGSETVTLAGADAEAFDVEGGMLYLKAGTTLNHEAKAGYAVTVRVADGALAGSVPVTADYALTVTDVNESPTAPESITPPLIATNDSYSFDLASVFGDPDAGDAAALAYTAQTELPAGLTLTPKGLISGTVSTAGTTSVTVTATDPDGLSVTRTFSLTAVDAPAFSTLVAAPALVTAGASFVVTATLTEAVIVSGGTPTLTLDLGGQSVAASYSGVTGAATRELLFTALAPQTGDSSGFGISGFGTGGATIVGQASGRDLVSPVGVAVSQFVVDNTAPSFEDGAAVTTSFAENGAGVVYGARVADATAVTYRLAGDDAARFEVDANGAIRFRSAPDFEQPVSAAQSNTYQVELIATDAVGQSSTQAVTISVTDVNEAPTGLAAIAGAQDDASPVTGNIPADGLSNDRSLLLSGSIDRELLPSEFVRVLDNGAPIGVAMVAGSEWTFQAEALADGPHSFTAVVENTEGNRGEVSAAYAVAIDATAPALAQVVGIAENSGSPIDRITNDRTPTLTVQAESGLTLGLGSGGVPLEASRYTVTESANGNGSSVYTIVVTDPQGLADAGYGVFARDAAGNLTVPPLGQPSAASFRIDSASPKLDAAVAMAGDDGRYDAGDRIRLDFSEPVDVSLLTQAAIVGPQGGSLGDGWRVEPVGPANGYASEFDIVLGDSPGLQPGDRITIAGSALADAAGNAAGEVGFDTPELPEPARTFVFDYLGGRYEVSLGGLGSYELSPYPREYEVSRFLTAAAVFRDDQGAGALRVIDLKTGAMLAGRALSKGEFLLPSQDGDTLFHVGRYGGGELTIESYDYGLSASDASVSGTPLSTTTVTLPEGVGSQSWAIDQYIVGEGGQPGYLSVWHYGVPGGARELYGIDASGAARIDLPSGIAEYAFVGNGFVRGGELWLSVFEDGRGSYHRLTAGGWEPVSSDSDFWDAWGAANGIGTVVRDGDDTVDLLALVPAGHTAQASDHHRVERLEDGSLLVRAEGAALGDPIGYELWAVFGNGQSVAWKTFDTGAGLGLRSLRDSEAGWVYFQQLDVSLDGGELVQAEEALTVYRIAAADVARALMAANDPDAPLATLAGAAGVEPVNAFTKTQLAGGQPLGPGQIVLLDGYVPAGVFAASDAGALALSVIHDPAADTDTAVASRIEADGTVSRSTVLPAEIAGAVPDAANGLFLLTAFDDAGSQYAYRVDPVSGVLTQITPPLFHSIAEMGGLPQGASFVAGTAGNDTIDLSAATTPQWIGGDAGNDALRGGSADDVLIGGGGGDQLYGNSGADVLIGMGGDDRLQGGTGADRLYGGPGTDRVQYAAPEELAGDTITGHLSFWDGRPETLATGADSTTDDRIQLLGAGTYDFGQAGVHVSYVDRVDVGVASGEVTVVLSAAMAASADRNGDGRFGDIRVVGYDGSVAGSTLPATTANVTVDASALLAGQSLVVTGQDGSGVPDPAKAFGGMRGHDTIIGGAGQDWIFTGAGNDVITGGGGEDLIDGGDGDDVAVYAGRYADYLFGQPDQSGGFTLTDTVAGRDGADYLMSIEELRFADGAWRLGPSGWAPALL